MNYSHFSKNEFIGDTAFRDWVYNPSEESDDFWNQFLALHPGKQADIAEARIFLTGIQMNVESDFSTQTNQKAVYERIKTGMGYDNHGGKWSVSWISWAAAACLIIAAGLWFSKSSNQIGIASYEENLESVKGSLTEKMNQTDTTMLVTLEDGSSVLLKPGSKVAYATVFNAGKVREVYLSGEAFFDVVKNPSKPFLVYANELVTKVLGTSFSVKAYETDENVTVKVSTGRVAVSVAGQVRSRKKVTSREADGILILPNQKAVLSRTDIRLVKGLVENPVLLETPAQAPNENAFVFRSASAADVFKALEKAYGVDIQYDPVLFDKCQLSANLTDESLYEKLGVICKSLEATYQILDAQIIVSGKGCND